MKRKKAARKAVKHDVRGELMFKTVPLDPDVDLTNDDVVADIVLQAASYIRKSIPRLQPGAEPSLIAVFTPKKKIIFFKAIFTAEEDRDAAMRLIRQVAAEENACVITYAYQYSQQGTGADGFMLQLRRHGDNESSCVSIPYTWQDGKAVAGEMTVGTIPKEHPDIIPAWWETGKAAAA